MTPTLLLVGANDETVCKAKDLGLRVLLLQHPTKLSAVQQELADLTRVVDYTDWSEIEPVVRELSRSPGFDVALSLTEAGLEPAGRINDMLGLGGTGFDVAHRFRDKWAMRRHVAGTDPAAVGAALLDVRGDLDTFGARYGHPFIVKPTDGTAGFGVFRVDAPQDAGQVWAGVERLRGRRTDRGSTLFSIQEFMMEEFVDGPEFSVESVSSSGRHVVVAVTEKFVEPDSLVELGHAVPARLAAPVQEEVRRTVAGFLDAVGLTDGVCHTEVRIGARGPAIIEGHNRIAGDAIPDLVRGAYGIDLTTYALARPFGLVPELVDPPRAHAGASTRVLVSAPGRVDSVAGVVEVGRLDGVEAVRITARPGDAVRPLTDNWDRLGLVAATGRDATTAIARCAHLIDSTVRIRVTADDGVVHLAHVAEVEHVRHVVNPMAVPS